ncbi:MAG: hypothetical protein V4638_09475 [Bacteroidota bacterium]
MKIKSAISICTLVVLFSACSSEKDQVFCDCMTAGEELNNHSKKLLEGAVTQEMADKQQVLLKTKKEKCKNYQTMSGPEMQKRKEACKE